MSSSESSIIRLNELLAAQRSADAWRKQILTTLWAVMKGNKGVYKKFKREWKALFDEPSDEELLKTVAAFPEKLRWWEVEAHIANVREAANPCKCCQQSLKGEHVKVCPECQVVLHVHCFTTTDAPYQTPDCECCRLRVVGNSKE